MSDKYNYDRFDSHGARVGQAVYDIMAQGNLPHVTAEDVTEARTEQYLKDIQEAADLGAKEFESPFYVVYLYNKEGWTDMATRGRFVRRQTEPLKENMVTLFPAFGKDVWRIDVDKGSIDYLWTLPSYENFNQILKNKEFYDPALNEWLTNPHQEMREYSKIDQ